MDRTFSEKQLAVLIQRTLLGGVVLCSALFLLAFILKMAGSAYSGRMFSAGALVLILTPVCRVCMLAYGYWRAHERRLAFAAFTVLALLFMSVIL